VPTRNAIIVGTRVHKTAVFIYDEIHVYTLVYREYTKYTLLGIQTSDVNKTKFLRPRPGPK